MTTSTLAPGCNMPCISYSRRSPGLWAYAVQATETGLVSALGDEDARRSDDRFQHLVFFPTFSQEEMAFFKVQPGAKVTVDAASDNCLKVTGPGFEVEFPGKIVVLYHGSLDGKAVKAYYA